MLETILERGIQRVMIGALAAAWLIFCPLVSGQWITQEIKLSPGWNAISLEVDPAAKSCATLFANLPIVESVWRYDRRFSTIQFAADPGTILPELSHWIAWMPPSNPESFLSRLTELQGGNSYMIKVADDATSLIWSVKGTPMPPADQWVPNTLNLSGFPVDAAAMPTVARFFKDNSAINIGPGTSSGFYSIGPDSKEFQIRQPERTVLKAGAAYWVKLDNYIKTASAFVLEGDYLLGKKLDFGADRTETVLAIRNTLPGTALSLRITVLPSEAPPAGTPELAGSIPLARFVNDAVLRLFEWRSVTNSFDIFVPAGQSLDLRLAIQRAQLKSYNVRGANGARYQGLLEINDLTRGMRVLVPIVASSSKFNIADKSRIRALTQNTTPAPDVNLPLYALSQGLWVGQATLTGVNQPSYNSDPAVAGHASMQVSKASSPLQTRLILHVDSSGTTRLLQRALMVWKPSTNDANTNGQYQVFTDELNVPATNQAVYRVSSTTLPLMAPQILTGTFGESVSGTVSLGYDDPVNPFKHQYHPDHDNKDESFSTNKLPAGVESFTVNRKIGLNFNIANRLDDGSFVPPSAVLKLNGLNSAISIDPFTIGASATIEAWVRIDQLTNRDQTVIFLSDGDAKSLTLKLNQTNGFMTLACTSSNTGPVSYVSTTNAFPVAQWVYVTAILDGEGLRSGCVQGRIYWNGKQVAAGPIDFPPGVLWQTAWFGRANTGAFLGGRIYDLTLWGDVRSDDELFADMQLGYTPAPDFLLASFPADEGSGTDLKDANGGALRAHLQQTTWDDNAGYRNAFWDIGDRQGIYTETITGLRPQPIIVQGTFKLRRLNSDGYIQ